MEDKNTKYQKIMEKLGISFILGIIGTFVIVSLNYLVSVLR